ncbi:DNA-directed RNA polymerase I subunit RPA12 [Lepeophtheirus salmonis]|uniref:DNA-directed RNA polymerase subunit n=1 Tax=Lepeophtheirus salmonis TaxID=72036 RepID=D3PHB2_LEPSM|nr:DNA-directed RNA polymerase I subunit RPA12-like [Lepeophtheirus salmonis]ADD37948.1 DNA-directed RNA polymerase I subunit RPA12 [Lepeophtheirus salmonis]
MASATFSSDPSFCSDCGSILPNVPSKGHLCCSACGSKADISLFLDKEISYSIEFNKREDLAVARTVGVNDLQSEPTVERTCSNCGHGLMSYAALQLRSADEGQTVFFTCLKCKFKETENS